jgi:hypothetical protein
MTLGAEKIVSEVFGTEEVFTGINVFGVTTPCFQKNQPSALAS